MTRAWSALRRHARLCVQVGAAVLQNGNLSGFLTGSIFVGPAKGVCLPGLNCYSCPGALGACPIGALQSTITTAQFNLAFYAVGFLVLVGALLGRAVCGWLCPFGLVQDLIHKIPLPARLRTARRKALPGERVLRGLKYLVLAGLVVVLPLTVLDIVGQGKPWFCEYLCPSGTLFGGIPLVAANPMLQQALGWLFTWKIAILVVLVAASLFIWRPFCRYLCPLGAVYGCFNRVALVRYELDPNACVKCGACSSACKMGLDPVANPNSHDCVRCGACHRACPTGALRLRQTAPIK